MLGKVVYKIYFFRDNELDFTNLQQGERSVEDRESGNFIVPFD